MVRLENWFKQKKWLIGKMVKWKNWFKQKNWLNRKIF